MPRSPEFDAKEVLENAMKQFWQYGYTDTSVDDLVAATGVSRYGLYGTFGGKRELFLKALDCYRDDLVTRQLGSLGSDDATWKDVKAYFERLVALSKLPAGQAGCFMCNTATELAPHDAEVSSKVNAHLRRLKNVFTEALRNTAEAEGLNDFNTEAFADTLVGVSQGMFVLSRSAENANIIENFVSQIVQKPS